MLLLCVAANQLIPSQHLHWRSLDPERPVGIATDFQLFRLSLSRSKTCMNMAENADGFLSSVAAPKDGKGVCGWKVARNVSGRDTIRLAGPVDMQCPLAIGTYIWLKETDRHARKHLGSPLKRVNHFGTFSCRLQNGNNSGRRSEHSFANAWDISGYKLEDGQSISVLKHWDGGTKAQKRFLRDVRDSACDIFRVTLSPDFNAAHKDHFHVDMGPSISCR